MEASPKKVYERWSENFWPDLFALGKLWVPATAMNFALVPCGCGFQLLRPHL